jgi:hypothetical protein
VYITNEDSEDLSIISTLLSGMIIVKRLKT